MKSVMNHTFARNPSANVQRSTFDRSAGHKTAIDADYLYPVFIDPILPGDTINFTPAFFARMATPIYPIMDNLYIDHFTFFVPWRIIWNNYHKFLGAQDDPGDSIDFTIPTMTSTTVTGYADDSLHDYLGIRPGIPDLVHQSLPHRCYNLIWNDWFRDENLQDSIVVDKDDGPDTPTDYVLQKRGKRHDYFTSCLPSPQKSSTAVSLPLGTSAPIASTQTATGTLSVMAPSIHATNKYALDSSGAFLLQSGTTSATDPLYADLSSATAATINAIRLAVTTQQFLERDARGGTRINELILSHFGVMAPDYRVQRPEYLGGGSTPVNIHQVPQTSQTATTPQGTMSAFGTSFSSEGRVNKSFTEHGFIMTLINVRADLTYQQGMERFWFDSTRYDLFWPEFANIGEQAVLQQEIFVTDPAGATNETVFGYQGRYDHYRYKPSRISSVFRSDHASTLDPWHLSEDLSAPALDSTFIPSNTPMARVEAVPAEPDFIVDCYFQYQHTRPMPIRGIPGLARF